MTGKPSIIARTPASRFVIVIDHCRLRQQDNRNTTTPSLSLYDAASAGLTWLLLMLQH